MEYVIDWERVETRSIFFDIFNFFIPWFARRSYDYLEIKKFMLNFIKNYLPNLKSLIEEKYDLYFNLFVLSVFIVLKILVHSYKIKRELLKGLIIFLKLLQLNLYLKEIKNNYFFKIYSPLG